MSIAAATYFKRRTEITRMELRRTYAMTTATEDMKWKNEIMLELRSP
jgi:hypothetical protein